MRFDRQQYLDLMTFNAPERPMFCELFGPLIGLPEEWRAQGATQDEIDMVGFDWDFVPTVWCGGNTGPINTFATQTISENDDELVQRDYLGRTTVLHKKNATIPLPLDFPVKTMDDWLKLKPSYSFDDSRIDRPAIEHARQQQAQGAMVIGHIPGAFDTVRELMGEENACCGYYDQPELIHDIMNTLADTSFRVLDQVSDELLIDQLSVHEDLAGRSGPLAGPTQVRQFFRPYWRRVWDMLQSRGTKLFEMDSDGNIDAIIADVIDAGLTSTYPLEPAAGMDMVKTRRKFGRRLALKGGIDKFVLGENREAIRAELEYKMQPLMREGGTVFGLDHRIPNGTPLEAYRYYVETGREILGLPPRGDSRGWGRMAF